ncbi:centrosomal protein of 162 kDa isoform X2 [Anopheles coustani]|uniref:centrosomal protein of 162 kDa isoform X2 n=1 Tax=Anopheles coustani TaxID=139045 RepID=UPI002658B347|nr:centrosomal protein of 162 kDa isoform X2 [Anopheles coustani]
MTAEVKGAELRKKPPKDAQCDSDESLDEFLDHELLCFLQDDGANGDTVNVVDLDREFFLHELESADNDTDGRSVDEILLEAELLMHKQQPIFAAADCDEKIRASRVRAPQENAPCEAATVVKLLNGLLKGSEQRMSGAERKDRVAGERHRENSNLPTESIPDAINNECNPLKNSSAIVVANGPTTVEAAEEETESEPVSHQGVANFRPVRNTKKESTLLCPTSGRSTDPDLIHLAQPTVASCLSNQQTKLNNNGGEGKMEQHELRRTVLRRICANCSQSDDRVQPVMCNKSTQPSPTSDGTAEEEEQHPTDDGPERLARWSQECLLESKITDLQERLKDTEERYQSLKLQYETLSQVHRTLRENYNAMQEESEKMQFDIQHLTKCASVLRTELQSARSDRDSAIELQKILQSELDESRKEKKRLQDSSEKDTKTIQDLQRQCREMERILMRKNPDSISALIVASKSSTAKADADSSSTCKLLEQRIAQLEADARKQDAKAQGILADVQARFNSVQAKYETHIADLEMQVLSLQEINSKLNEKIIRQMEELASFNSQAVVADAADSGSKNVIASCTQTDEKHPEQRDCTRTRSVLVQTDVEHSQVSRSQQQQTALAKRAQTQGKEDAHLLATIRGMRVDLAIKEKAVQRLTREVDECKKTIKKIQKKKEGPAIRSDSGRSPVKVRNKVSENADPEAIISLRDMQAKIKNLEMDYKALQEKRLLDLKTLQAAHEKELASCHESIRILQQRLAESEEERVHRKDKQRPNHNNDYYGLKAKVAYLERRHTEREQRLLMLVEALSK